MESKQTRKILKSPVAKRRSRLIPKDQKVTLERVLGLTSTSNATFACDPNTGLIAYPAGCVVVLYNPKKNKQGHIFNVSKKTITSLAFSGDGKHLITGESGYQPAVRVWDIVEKTQVAEFHGHKFGINCVAFSPNLKYIVSIGTQHDKQVNVWNWRTGSKVASNKVSIKVTAVSFSSDGSYFVTAGMRHVKFWYLDNSKSKINETVPLNGRNGLLGDHKNNFFCDVVSGTGPEGKQTFCITQSGFLCQFNETRQMDKWVELRTTSANSISVAGKYIFVGCAKGIVRVFDSSSLHYVATLPRPHHLGVDIAAAVNPSQLNSAKDGDLKYPDTLGVRYDEEHGKCTCIYNDHSMYIWDVHDLKKIGKAWSFLYHSSCVYGIEVYPALETGSQQILPPHSFFTCSSDDTIRVWNLDPHMAETANYKGNIYSHDLLKIMYMDPSLTSLCDIDYNPSGATDKTDTNYDDKNGIRSIRVSPDGQHLASGDRQGNVRIHELDKLIEIKQIEAHESEVLSLEYSHWKNGPKLLASSSRDRLIHVFDVEQQYGLLQTLSDHSSSISAVKFVNTDDELKMISCGADKSIMFRNLKQDPEFQFSMATQKVEKMTLYDMDVEPMQKFTAIACQDRNVRIYNVKTGKKKKEYKGSLSDDGILLKMKLDPSGSYAATSCSDKNMCIIDFYTGELQASMFGHSEIATDVRFMNDLRHLISSSGDGCIFVWRLPQSMTSQMQSRLKDIGHISPQLANGGIKPDTLTSVNQDVVDAVMGDREFLSPERILKEMYPTYYSNKESPSPKDNTDFRFSISQLPGWAQKKFDGDGTENKSSTEESGSGPAPRGRWAQRADGQGPTIKTQDGKSVEVDGDRRRFSYQADAANSHSADVRRETMVLNRPEITPTNMPVIFDEGNDDDDDDFLPVSSKTFVKQDTQDKSDITWDDLYNFDADEGDQGENTEIIYYPPSESDGSDTLASSYQVFDAGLSSERRRSQFKHSISMNSNADGDSETTDPVSLDDIDDDDDSNNSVPTTPMDEPPKSQNREKFLKDTFENLSFTPSETDKFVKGLETLEEEMDSVPAGMITSRQSLSARFLSKSQAVRGLGPCGNIQRQDNWYDSVQRGKDNMARNLDESRKMLMAMGWKQESPETDGEDPFVDSHKPPTSPKHVTPKQNQDKFSSKSTTPSDDNTINPALNIRDHQPTPPTSSAGVSSKSSDQHHTPTSSRRSLSSSSSRPRTLPLDRSGGRLTPTDKSTNKMTVKSGTTTRKDTPTGSQQSTRLSEYKKNTRLSTPNLGKVQIVSPEPRRSSSGSNLAKSKSNSMHNLTFEDDELELTPRGTNRKSRSKWSTPKMSSFASVPNLLNPDDDGKLAVVSFDENKQDINDNVLKEKSVKPTTKKSPQVGSRGDSDVRLTRRAASTSRLQSEEKKSLSRKVGMSATNLRSLDNKSKDRDLMPPPTFTSVAKKQESRFMKRAQQPRRKTTGGSELTFEEAKNILKGNSGILNGKGEKEKRSSSISPSRNISKAVKSTDSEEVVSKSDLSNNVTDSEMSSVESRKSSSSSVLSLGNKLDQFEALDGDTSSECDTHKNRGRPAKSPTRVSVKPILAKDHHNEGMNNDYKDSLRDSGVSTQDEEDCPSPSVKERIARLNKHAGSSEKLHPHSLLRDQNRAESPEPSSSRQTSTVQISLSKSSVSTSSSASVAMATTADSMTTIGSSVSPLRGTDSFQSSVQTFSDNNYNLHQNLGASPSSLSNPNLSPPSGMGTSLDSEGLSHHLSPGNQSNGSPRSVADTGLGSDTDLENSQTFRRGQFNGPGDSHSMVEKFDQMLVLMNQISIQHKQMQENPDNVYAEVMAQCDQRFSSLCKSYCETFGKSLNSVTGKDEIIKEALDELQRNMQKVKDLVNS